MLRATFQHLGGVGPVTEAELWRAGVRDWATLADRLDALGLDAEHARRLARELAASERALAEGDAPWFGRRLADREHWRLHSGFRERTAYLDIETTGLSPYAGIVTVVSVHGGGATRTFVAGDNLEEVSAYLRRFPILVTFNGSRFDVPFLEACFPGFAAPPVHIDLRFVLYRLGLAGGLKRIEQRLGIGDRAGVEGVGGLDAVRLWQAYRRGSAEALDRLIRYNRADTVNLEPLLEYAEQELTRRLLPEDARSRAEGQGRARAAPAGG
ncbi:MAG: ribonuclease H-like domain-containing protein [Thermoplasmata archaeon]